MLNVQLYNKLPVFMIFSGNAFHNCTPQNDIRIAFKLFSRVSHSKCITAKSVVNILASLKSGL